MIKYLNEYYMGKIKHQKFELDSKEIIKRTVKYISEGTAVALAARYIPAKKININEVAMIALTAACVFAMLDLYAPSVSLGVRQGAGFAIGSSVVGGLDI